MAREYFERQNSSKRSSQRSSSAGPLSRQPRDPYQGQDETDFPAASQPSAQLRNQAFVDERYRNNSRSQVPDQQNYYQQIEGQQYRSELVQTSRGYQTDARFNHESYGRMYALL